MEEVAERTNPYLYFASKRDLFAAIHRRAADELLAAVTMNPSAPLLDQALSGLDAHIDYLVAIARRRERRTGFCRELQ